MEQKTEKFFYESKCPICETVLCHIAEPCLNGAELGCDEVELIRDKIQLYDLRVQLYGGRVELH